MIFKKRLNNNVVIAIDGTDEKILTGKGLDAGRQRSR